MSQRAAPARKPGASSRPGSYRGAKQGETMPNAARFLTSQSLHHAQVRIRRARRPSPRARRPRFADKVFLPFPEQQANPRSYMTKPEPHDEFSLDDIELGVLDGDTDTWNDTWCASRPVSIAFPAPTPIFQSCHPVPHKTSSPNLIIAGIRAPTGSSPTCSVSPIRPPRTTPTPSSSGDTSRPRAAGSRSRAAGPKKRTRNS